MKLSQTIILIYLYWLDSSYSTTTPSYSPYIPYGDCEIYSLGPTAGHRRSGEEPFYSGSTLSIYPLTDHFHPFQLYISFPGAVYKVAVIKGTMLQVMKCNEYGYLCRIVNDSNKKKISNFVPNMWNDIILDIHNSEVLVSIGGEEVLIMPLEEQLHQINEAQLSVVYIPEPNNRKGVKENKQTQYQVQFMCIDFIKNNEYLLRDMNANHPYYKNIHAHNFSKTGLEDRRKASASTNIILIIAGVIIAAILIIGVSYFVYKTFKSCKTVPINEKTELQQKQ